MHSRTSTRSNSPARGRRLASSGSTCSPAHEWRARMGLFGGLIFLAKEVAQRAEDELYDEEGARNDLVALHKSLEEGTLMEAEFEVRETELLQRLEEISARKRGGRRGPSQG